MFRPQQISTYGNRLKWKRAALVLAIASTRVSPMDRGTIRSAEIASLESDSCMHWAAYKGLISYPNPELYLEWAIANPKCPQCPAVDDCPLCEINE